MIAPLERELIVIGPSRNRAESILLDEIRLALADARQYDRESLDQAMVCRHILSLIQALHIYRGEMDDLESLFLRKAGQKQDDSLAGLC